MYFDELSVPLHIPFHTVSYYLHRRCADALHFHNIAIWVMTKERHTSTNIDSTSTSSSKLTPARVLNDVLMLESSIRLCIVTAGLNR